METIFVVVGGLVVAGAFFLLGVGITLWLVANFLRDRGLVQGNRIVDLRRGPRKPG